MKARKASSTSRPAKPARPFQWLTPPQRTAEDAEAWRAEQRLELWAKFGQARSLHSQGLAWLQAIALDTSLGGGACRFCTVLFGEIDPATGEAELSHEDFAFRLDLSEKQISNLANGISEAGYLTYQPGKKGKTYSRFRMRVPDVGRIEDAVRQKKTSPQKAVVAVRGAAQSTDLGGNKFPERRKKTSPSILTSKMEGGSAPLHPSPATTSGDPAPVGPIADGRMQPGKEPPVFATQATEAEMEAVVADMAERDEAIDVYYACGVADFEDEWG